MLDDGLGLDGSSFITSNAQDRYSLFSFWKLFMLDRFMLDMSTVLKQA